MATVSISMDAAEIAAVAQQLTRTVDEVQKVAAEAAQATAVWLRDRIASDLFAQTGMTQALFARRVKKYLRTGVDAGGRVFVGLFRPDASRTNLGQLSQSADGAQGGKYFFKGAFVAQMPGGFIGIFRRNTKLGRRGNPMLERISIDQVDLPSAQQVIAAHELPAEVYFRREFDRLLGSVLA